MMLSCIMMLLTACASTCLQAFHFEAVSLAKPIQPMKIGIILGSTREGRSSDKIGKKLFEYAYSNNLINAEIIDLRDYDLPFLSDAQSPAQRTHITNPIIKKWSDKINELDGFILIVPEYNASYPAVLKNALDVLYKEWNNKPIACIGYSGGSGGGSKALAHLDCVLRELRMIKIGLQVTIPTVWKAFDAKGNFINKSTENEFKLILDELYKAWNP